MTRLFDAACYIGQWPSAAPVYPRVGDLLETMDRLGIERALVNHTLAWQYSPVEGNQALMEEIAGQPRLEACWGITPGYALDRYSGVAGLEDALRSHNVRAVRIYPRDHVYPLTGWMVDDLFSMLNSRKMVVFLDLDQVFLQVGLYDYDANGLRNLEWVCQTYPDLSLVVSRVGYRAYHTLFALMQHCPNLCLDLSYFATHQGVEDLVNRFGVRRVLFGTSQPFVEPGGALARLQYAGLSPGQKEAIGSRNLDDLLGRAEDPLSAAECPRVEARFLDPQVEIIDAHGHLGPYFKFSIPNSDARGMVEVMDACGVKMAAISSHLAISGDWQTGNQVTLQAVRQFPDRLIGQVVVSPNEPQQIRDELIRYVDESGFRAIKVVPDTHGQSIQSKGYEPMWEFATERGCLVLSHTFHGSAFDDPGLFGLVSERYPDVPVLIVHSGALTAAFENAILLAQQHSNLYLDVSGSYITSPWIKRMVDTLGADRVVFSSDIPFIDQRYSLGRVMYAGLTPDQLRLILGGNARRLYGLIPQESRTY